MCKNLLFIFCFLSAAGFSQIRTAARISGLAHVQSVQFDAGKVGLNPALKHSLNGITSQLNQNFGVFSKLYQDISFGTQWNYPKGDFALELGKTGISDYHHLYFGVSASKQFGKLLYIGQRVKNRKTLISNYSTQNIWSTDIGLVYQFHPSALMGVYIQNIGIMNTEAVNTTSEEISMGIKWTSANNTQLIMEGKWTPGQIQLILALEYNILDQFKLTYGLNTFSFQNSVGTGIRFKKWGLDLSYVISKNISSSPQISINYGL